MSRTIVYSQFNMKKIGSLFVSKETLLIDEKLLWSCHVSHLQSKARIVKGKLYVTTKRVIFSASYFDRISEGKCWNIPIKDIKAIKTQSIVDDIFIRGANDKLKIVLANNKCELFSVKNLRFVIKKLNNTLKKLNIEV
ncbi:GRAM domain-containing protein [Haloplasma contractile]|uniref:GRAM domain protein n=1 Tax=Haloplasma contractile SSD-17B TaxID=1033810 RepID=U2FGW6_9MOLU|nr:GRAM domain-containing protein [Haloplasma contractile]ERJ12095.1 GRAM domain protein [Haloplasma contractile SSD-17B]